MARNITVTFADGTNHVYQNAPDDVTPDMVQARAEKEFSKPVKGLDGGGAAKPVEQQKPETTFLQGAGNLAKGALVGLSDIGDTAIDLGVKATGGMIPKLDQWNRTRNADMEYIQDKYKDSPSFTVGRIGGNVVSTYPVGGVLGQGAKALGASPAIVNALATSGARAGATPGALNTLARIAGGATTGGVSSTLVNPDSAGTGAVVGGALPVVGAVASKVGQGVMALREAAANRLMQSAIKPTIAQLKSGDADTAIQTLLQYGVNPTRGGVERLRELSSGINDEIADKIENSTATVDKSKVLTSLNDVVNRFSKQVSPTADLNAIRNIGEDFIQHPNYPGAQIPVQAAQEMKQGTYRVLAKKYGQIGTADTEAQKGLARGLKEEIATAVPGIAGLNAQESRLITTLGVAERRALMEMNKNPLGLSLLTSDPRAWAAFMADKSALFKSMAARLVNPSNAAQQGSSLQKLMPIAGKVAPAISSESERGN